MKHATLIKTVAVAAAGTLLLAGCTAQPASKKIAGVVGLGNDPFFISVMCGADAAAKADGNTIEWSTVSEQTVAQQQTKLDAALLKNPNGVLLSAVDAKAFSDQIKQTMSDGIPVVAVNAPVDGDVVASTVVSSTDNAEFIKYVAKDMGTTGKIAIFGGVPGDIPVLTGRWQPLVDQLAKSAPGIKVLETQYDGFDRAKTTQMAAALLTANPDITALYAVSGPEGEGLAAAVEEAGLSGKVKVYSYDATPAEVVALKAGTINALLAQGAGLIGSEGYKKLVAQMKDAKSGTAVKASKDSLEIPLKVLTSANVNDADSKDYTYVEKCN